MFSRMNNQVGLLDADADECCWDDLEIVAERSIIYNYGDATLESDRYGKESTI